MKNRIKRVFIIFLLLFCGINAFAADTSPAPYTDEEFPTGLQDLRRFEIITFGSMPFVTLDVNFAYALGKPVYNCVKSGDWSTYTFQNPLTASSEYSKDEMKAVIWTSIGISVGIALTDYIVNIIKRHKKIRATQNNDTIMIYNITEDPDAVKLENPFIDLDRDSESSEVENVQNDDVQDDVQIDEITNAEEF